MQYEVKLNESTTVMDLAEKIGERLGEYELEYRADVGERTGVIAGERFAVYLKNEIPGTRYQRLNRGMIARTNEFLVRELDGTSLDRIIRSLSFKKDKGERKDLMLIAVTLAAALILKKK